MVLAKLCSNAPFCVRQGLGWGLTVGGARVLLGLSDEACTSSVYAQAMSDFALAFPWPQEQWLQIVADQLHEASCVVFLLIVVASPRAIHLEFK